MIPQNQDGVRRDESPKAQAVGTCRRGGRRARRRQTGQASGCSRKAPTCKASMNCDHSTALRSLPKLSIQNSAGESPTAGTKEAPLEADAVPRPVVCRRVVRAVGVAETFGFGVGGMIQMWHDKIAALLYI